MPAAIVSSIAGRPGLRGGDLDEQVRAVDEGVQALGLLDRALGVVGEARVDLERDPAVAGVLADLVPLRAQDVAGAADVLDGEREEDLLGLGLVLEHLAQLLVVGVALGDRRLEDRGVRGDAVHALAHEPFEIAVPDEGARQEVDPDALPVGGELVQRSLGHVCLQAGGRWEFVGSTSEDGTSAIPSSATHGGRPLTGGVSERARRARAARRRPPARRGGLRAAWPHGPGWP